MIKAFVMIGVQGSGKSTIAECLAEEENAVIIATDEIRKQIAEKQGITYGQVQNQIVFARFYGMAKNLAKQGKNIIFDATNINENSRKGIFQALADFQCQFIACVLDSDKKTCLNRIKQREKDNPQSHRIPPYVVDDFIDRFRSPTIDEGFNEIRIIGVGEQNQIYRRRLNG